MLWLWRTPLFCVHYKSLGHCQAKYCILHPHLNPTPIVKPLSNIGIGKPTSGLEEGMLGTGCDLIKQNRVEVGAVGNELLSHHLNVGDIGAPFEPVV